MSSPLRSRLIHIAADLPKGDPTRRELLASLKEAASNKQALDADEQRLYDALHLIAKNDGQSYKRKDAKGAVAKAWKEWKKSTMERHEEDFDRVEKALVKEIGAWMRR
jgi:hypothetical protein